MHRIPFDYKEFKQNNNVSDFYLMRLMDVNQKQYDMYVENGIISNKCLKKLIVEYKYLRRRVL